MEKQQHCPTQIYCEMGLVSLPFSQPRPLVQSISNQSQTQSWVRVLWSDSYWSIQELLFKTTWMATELLITWVNKFLLQNWQDFPWISCGTSCHFRCLFVGGSLVVTAYISCFVSLMSVWWHPGVVSSSSFILFYWNQSQIQRNQIICIKDVWLKG